jgi:hypothetical protein
MKLVDSFDKLLVAFTFVIFGSLAWLLVSALI